MRTTKRVIAGLRHTAFVAVAAIFLGGAVGAHAGAKVDVHGAGWWHSRELEKTVELLVRPEQSDRIDAGAIEDAALILISELQGDGYLRPRVTARLPRPDGTTAEYTWDETLATFLPRPLDATGVDFRLEPGVRYLIKEVTIEGLTAFPREQGEAYFRGETYLLPLAEPRIYTPTRFDRSLANLQEELRQRGFGSASVTGQVAARDDHSGDVKLKVSVFEGSHWVVGDVSPGKPVDPAPPAELLRRQAGRPYSSLWEQNFAQRLRNFYHQQGYPDAQVKLVAGEVSEPAATPAVGARPTAATDLAVKVAADIEPGPRVLAGPVRFAGSKGVRESVLNRQVRLTPGEPLNPERVAETRERLIRLGVFRNVDLDYEPATGPVRSPVFTLTPGREQDFNLMGGWGSYERLRGGIEYRHYNVLSLAHQVRIDAVQSLKSSRGELNYLVPDILGEAVDGTANIFGLQRDERAFRREEYGGSLGLKRHVAELGGDVSLTYSYQSLRSANSTLETSAGDLIDAKVASIDLTFLRDRQDNPLRPRRGYRLFVRTELASKFLGGEVDYQRIELGGTWHRRLGRGRWVHLGFSHGVVTTYGGSGDGLPVNKRFFPGGENSVRGYGEGEAAPRSADGSYLGAKSYLMANLELEQALTRNWSVVAFTDAIGVTSRLAGYPFDQEFGSVGLGVRYHSLIGPVRLEYGHNVNRRDGDPAGTVHFSVGFPF